jgi:hypothetical protein
MAKSPFMPAQIRSSFPRSKAASAEEDLEGTEEITTLRIARECVVVDDVVLQRIFGLHVHSIQQEDLLESLAEALGSPRLSKVVKETHQAFTPRPTGPQVQELCSLVLERSTLFLHEREGNKKEVVRGADWLKKHLKVVEVAKLEQVCYMLEHSGSFLMPYSTSPCSSAAQSG